MLGFRCFNVHLSVVCMIVIAQVTRIDGTIDSPPCLKVTHKTFGTQISNNDMVYCRMSMPVEFHSSASILEESQKLRLDRVYFTAVILKPVHVNYNCNYNLRFFICDMRWLITSYNFYLSLQSTSKRR